MSLTLAASRPRHALTRKLSSPRRSFTILRNNRKRDQTDPLMCNTTMTASLDLDSAVSKVKFISVTLLRQIAKIGCVRHWASAAIYGKSSIFFCGITSSIFYNIKTAESYRIFKTKREIFF